MMNNWSCYLSQGQNLELESFNLKRITKRIETIIKMTDKQKS